VRCLLMILRCLLVIVLGVLPGVARGEPTEADRIDARVRDYADAEVSDGALVMRYPHSTTALVPVEGGLYFDRAYWSFIRFVPGKLIYRNGSDDFVAPRRP
jgi:hypothetical protein